MSNFPLIIDVFEGSGLLDLPKLKENNIQYIMVRLGAYSRLGGLMGNRKDDLFDKQWALLDTDPWFKKIIYIPYNPWISWQKNLSFLLENMPKNCYGVELDVENKRTLNYTSKTYGAEFAEYFKNITSNIQKIIYTGEAFLEYLDVWPKGNYSWAQYPYELRPSDSVYWSWDYLRSKLNKYIGPYNQNKAPDKVQAWQFTGDKVILDGSSKGMDVYAWLGKQEELDKLFSSNVIPPIKPPNPDKSRFTGNVLPTVSLGLNIRESSPAGKIIGKLNHDDYFEADTLDDKGWFHITFPSQGFISSIWTKYIDNQKITIPENKNTIDGVVSIDKLNVRIGVGTNYSLSTIIQPFKKNDKVTLQTPFSHDVYNNIWGKIDDNNWICIRYNNIWYVNLIDNYTSFIVPSVGEFVQTNHDYQGAEYDFKPRSIVNKTKISLPETINLLGANPYDFFPLNEEWQRFWFALLKKADNGIRTDSELVKSWIDLIADRRAFTDFHAPENGFHDYITGRNPEGKPVAMKNLTTGGNLLKILGRNGNKLTVEALDVTKSPPKVEDVWGKNWLIHWATQETIFKLPDNTFRVISFPQLTPLGTPIPVLSNGGTTIVMNDLVHTVENNKTYNIYNG